MELDTAKKFLSALDTVGLKDYEFVTDMSTRLLNNDTTAFCVVDEPGDSIYNFRKRLPSETYYKDNIISIQAQFGDIHEARFAASYEKMKEFIEVYGLPISDDQLKILINIDNSNRDIKPSGGDYLFPSTFVELTEEEIALLDDESKAKYEKDLATWKESKKLPKGVAARVN
jgi:hypothetical protein